MCKVLLDHFFGKLTCCDAEVSSRPEMSSPVPFLHPEKFFKYFTGRSPFDAPHDFRRRNLRGSGNQYVGIVFADNASQYLNLKPFAGWAHQIPDSHGKVALKNLVTIFLYPHKMVLDLVFGVAATAVVHASFLKATAS